MAGQTGQEKKMNGGWNRYLQWWGPAAVLIILLAWAAPKAWQAAVQPQLDAQQKLTEQLASQIPMQTEVLIDIREQGYQSIKLQRDTLDQLKERQQEHKEHSKEHKELCDALKAHLEVTDG